MFSALLLLTLSPQIEVDTFTKDAVVKISCQYRHPDIYRPWTKQPTREGGGSGIILDSGWIATNAHVVRYATKIYVQPNGAEERYEVEAKFVSYEDDLALLKPRNTDFFDLFPGVQINTQIPPTGSPVKVIGYPKGGQELSTTEGVVSRIQYHRSGYYSGLVIEIDAAVNQGNSGGPVVSNGAVIAIVMSGMGKDEAEGINWNIPAAKLESLINDCADGEYDGKPEARVSWIKAENDRLREYLNISPSETGVLVSPDTTWSPENIGIQKWDFLTEIAGFSVSNFGKVKLENGSQVEWMHFVSRKKVNEKGQVPIKIIRKGMPKDVLLGTSRSSDIPWVINDRNGFYPSYYIYGPLVFVEVSNLMTQKIPPYFYAAKHMITKRVSTLQKKTDERIIVVAGKLLNHSIAKGYESVPFPVLKRINGSPILNLKELVKNLEALNEGLVLFQFDSYNFSDLRTGRLGAQDMVFDHQEVLDTRDEMLEDAGIRLHHSKDLAGFIRQ